MPKQGPIPLLLSLEGNDTDDHRVRGEPVNCESLLEDVQRMRFHSLGFIVELHFYGCADARFNKVIVMKIYWDNLVG